MSDEQRGRRPGPDEPPYGREDDATRPQPVYPDDATRRPPGVPDDATRVQPNPDNDATRVQPNHPDEAYDPTQQMPRTNDPLDRTAMMPPVGGGEQAWSGRAEVRPPRADQYDDTAADWSTERPSEPRGKWWMPILIGVIALILLALLGWGIYLIAQNQDDSSTPVPTPTAPPTPTATVATTAPPTTAPVPTTPATPQVVTVPALRGLSQDAAEQALSRRGLSTRLKYRNSTEAPPGTVIDSDPAEGQEVPPDSVVTLIIARAQPSPSASSSSSATPGTAGD